MRINMMRSARNAALACGAALMAIGNVANAAAPMADIDARVSYETRQVTASGVTRVDTWEERLVRRGNQVWTERILPPTVHAAHERETVAEHAGHKHFNGEVSARWLTLAPDGKVDVKFVDHEHKVVVSVPSAEFGTVGFDGRYDGAASVVPPSVVQGMKPATKSGMTSAMKSAMKSAMELAASASNTGQWFTDRSQGWSHRVLWSESRQLAMRVESQRDDGSIRRVVAVQLQPVVAGRPAPWSQLASYTSKNYDDFMD